MANRITKRTQTNVVWCVDNLKISQHLAKEVALKLNWLKDNDREIWIQEVGTSNTSKFTLTFPRRSSSDSYGIGPIISSVTGVAVPMPQL